MRLLEAGDEPIRPNSDPAGALRVGGDADLSALRPLLPTLDLVVVTFGGFRDGRGFSLGATLREAGFAGELRAAGDLLPDHAPLLARCGFDSAELPAGAHRPDWEKALAAFSAVYQPAADGAATIWSRRSRGAAPVPLQPIRAGSSPAGGGGPRRSVRAGESRDGGGSRSANLAGLNAEFRDAPAEAILEAAITRLFPGRIAVLSSFGAEAAVGLHLTARVDAATPVLFLDTERHFEPTLQYRDRLARALGLTDVRVLRPKAPETADPRGDLWRTDPDACCALRKVRPLAAVAPAFDALITGRKRFHGGSRLRLPVFEQVGGQVRVNPLANWDGPAIEAYFAAHGLEKHPLTQGGYRSIGCWPCTQPSAEEEDIRAGRWAGLDKTECGIHMPERWVAEAGRRAS
jgi:phosphoadenylyl-sulfate reductase (thioredoxin)